MINTLENTFGEHIKVLEFDKEVYCPLDGTLDQYHVILAYTPNDVTIEDISFKRWIKMGIEPMFMERYAQYIFEYVDNLLNPDYLSVILNDNEGTLHRECRMIK